MALIQGLVDTQKQNLKSLGVVNAGDSLEIQLEVKERGGDIEFVNPIFELLAIKSDGTRVRQLVNIRYVGNIVIIEGDEQLVSCPGVVSLQLIINDNKRMSTCLFYFMCGKSFDRDIIQSIDKVGVLQELDSYVITMFSNLKEFEERIIEVDKTIRKLSEDMNEAEKVRGAAETKRQETFQAKQEEREKEYQESKLDKDNDYNLAEKNRDNLYKDAESSRNQLYLNEKSDRNNKFEQEKDDRKLEFNTLKAKMEEATNNSKNEENRRALTFTDLREAMEHLKSTMIENNNVMVNNESGRVAAETKRVADFNKMKEDNTTLGNNLTQKVDNKIIEIEKINEDFKKNISAQYEDIVTEFDKVIANVTNGNENATNSEIVQARGKEVNLNARLDNFDEQLDNNANELKKIKTFNIFPSDEVLSALPINSTFEVKGFYDEGDMPKCLYKKVLWSSNSIDKTNYCIKPITEQTSEISLVTLGIKPGSENAKLNSQIISNTFFEFGSVIKLPVGDFYFDRPINLKSKQCSLIGTNMSFTRDLNTKGITCLYFPNLLEGESAITIGAGTLANFVLIGNINNYSFKIDRSKTYVDKNNIVNEVVVNNTKGIVGGSTTTIIKNVHVRNFYYGVYLTIGNYYINSFYASECHFGISVGGDTKCVGVYGWDVHTLLQIRASISSAMQVRGDSVCHLVNVCGGNTKGVQLSDLDADYCLGSVILIGEKDVWGSVSGLIVNGIVGRHCVYNCYDITTDEPPTSDSILNSDDVSLWGFIGVLSKTHLNGAIITLSNELTSNPMDATSNYRTPDILLAIGTNSNVIAEFITPIKDYYGTNGATTITKQVISNMIKSFSANTNNTRITLITPSNNYYYLRNGSAITTKTNTLIDLA